MVERITKRSFRVEGDNYVAVKTDEYVNGSGKKIFQTVEEHGISPEEINEVVSTLADQELLKVNEEYDKLLKEHEDLSFEIKEVVESEEYNVFKEYLSKEETKQFFKVLNTENTLKNGTARLNELERTKNDVQAWKEQFIGLRDEIDKYHNNLKNAL